jgi:hypothetical protein
MLVDLQGTEGGIAAQFTLTKARAARGECLWMARAMVVLQISGSHVRLPRMT